MVMEEFHIVINMVVLTKIVVITLLGVLILLIGDLLSDIVATIEYEIPDEIMIGMSVHSLVYAVIGLVQVLYIGGIVLLAILGLLEIYGVGTMLFAVGSPLGLLKLSAIWSLVVTLLWVLYNWKIVVMK